MDPDDHKTNALLLAAALGVVLDEDEGVVVHHEGKGYIVSLMHNKDDTWHVTVDCDDEFLKYPHLQMLMLHDSPKEDEEAEEAEEFKETLQ